MTACGASAACGGFGPARNTAATFDAFYWLQVTNYGLLYVLFDSAPSGSNYIDVWDLCLHAQTPPNYFVANVFSDDPRREQAEKAVSTNRLPLFELARVLARLDDVAPLHRKRESQHHVSGC